LFGKEPKLVSDVFVGLAEDRIKRLLRPLPLSNEMSCLQ
jgi:hypothetical protein